MFEKKVVSLQAETCVQMCTYEYAHAKMIEIEYY